MPRFVVLQHDPPAESTRSRHWDLMLEDANSLRTWALAEPPTDRRPVAAEQLADHRVAYLDYEGPVSGNRGSVVRWESGHYRLLAEDEHVIRCEVRGRRLVGSVLLERPPGSTRQWVCTFHRSRHAPPPGALA